jgi:hypothetical protein
MIHNLMIVLTAALLIWSLGASGALARGGAHGGASGHSGGSQSAYGIPGFSCLRNPNGWADWGYGNNRYNCYPYGAGF